MIKKISSLFLFLYVFIFKEVVHANSVTNEQDKAPSIIDFISSIVFWDDILVFLFFLGNAFPVLHLLHCLPWFREKSEEVNHNVEIEKGISIIVPCYNEQGIIETSINSVKTLPYSQFEVIYINDGSTDETLSLLNKFLKLTPCSRSPLRKLSHKKVKNVYQSKLYPHIFVLDKTNGGKADALNAGIEYSSQSLVVTLDADTILTDQALSVINKTFEDKDVVAAGGVVHVLQTKTSKPLSSLSLLRANMLVRLQTLDFLKAFYVTKLSLARFQALAVISGAFGIFTKQALLNVGGYRSAIGEDIDITLRIHKYVSKHKNKKIALISEAVAYTELPENWKDFFKQRVRWQKAFIDCVIHFRSFFCKTLFTKAVSFFYIFESFVGRTITAYIMTGLFVINIIFNPFSSDILHIITSLLYILLFHCMYNLIAIGVSKYYGFRFQKKDIYRLFFTILLDIFIYRFIIMNLVMYGSIAYFFNKDWNKVNRTGRDYQTDSKSVA
ncbi:glycosyltransferase [Lederbergia citri]|uniref:Glycosyltransferase family 2 protein n=1 Tax=Lederbergia citri TaxID=2833580 RepID=A0A942YHC3_9BACI|nr:glycosyltransferase family 2 protein [Lederbergia citri]MBS4195619.1 glycosyltransferase family 2 protein [Lederbergia citri]